MNEPDPERVAQAWALRTHEGLSYQEIADRLGISKGTAHAWVGRAGDALEAGPVQDRHSTRQRDAATVDAWLARGEELYGAESIGWLEFVRGAVPLLQHKARLLGLFMPVRVQMEDQKRPPDPALLAAMELEARRAQAADEQEQERALEDA